MYTGYIDSFDMDTGNGQFREYRNNESLLYESKMCDAAEDKLQQYIISCLFCCRRLKNAAQSTPLIPAILMHIECIA